MGRDVNIVVEVNSIDSFPVVLKKIAIGGVIGSTK